MAAVKQVLLETLTGFRNKELQKFKELLQLIVSQKEHQWIWFGPSDAADTVDEMMQTCGRRSLDLTREVMEKMNRSDLMQKLSASSLGLTGRSEKIGKLSHYVIKGLINTLWNDHLKVDLNLSRA